MTDDSAPIKLLLSGRARYLRDIGESKSPGIMEAALKEIERLEGEVTSLRAFEQRVLKAVEFTPRRDESQNRRDAAQDLRNGMSLRQVSQKHGLGIGKVRGIVKSIREFDELFPSEEDNSQ